MSEENLQRMALALADIEAELIRRRESQSIEEPSDEMLDSLDSFEDDDDYSDIDDLYDGEVDNEDD